MHAPGIFVRIALGAFLSLVSAAAIAQAPPAGTRVPEPQPDLRPPPGIDIKPLAPPVSKPMVTGTVTVTRFRFTGLTVVNASELEPVVAPWIGRELSAPDLLEAINAVTAYLRQRGLFVAHAYLPDQRITDGEVEIAILEGRVGKLKLEQADDTRLKRSVAEGYLASLQSGSLIARGEFDTPLLLLNDLPGVRVTPTLTPGSMLGTADLTIKVEDERTVSGYLRLDNHEIRELGEYQLTAYLRLRNPLGIGDLATVRLVGTHTGERKYGTGTYSLPVNSLGTRAGFALTHQKYRLGGDFEPLQANGDYTDVTLALLHPFIRSHDRNLSGSLSLNEIRYRDLIDAVAFASESRHRYATARILGDRTDGLFGGGRSSFYVEYQTGRVFLDTPAVAAADAAGLGVNGRFDRGRARLERVQYLSSRSNLTFSVLAQMSSKNLDAGRELQLGGAEAVRAYSSGELYADEGHLAKIEYRHVLPLADSWRSAIAVFLDHGHARINKHPLPGAVGNTRNISGYGFSFAIGKRDAFTADITFAWRGNEAPLTDIDRRPRVWFVATQSF